MESSISYPCISSGNTSSTSSCGPHRTPPPRRPTRAQSAGFKCATGPARAWPSGPSPISTTPNLTNSSARSGPDPSKSVKAPNPSASPACAHASPDSVGSSWVCGNKSGAAAVCEVTGLAPDSNHRLLRDHVDKGKDNHDAYVFRSGDRCCVRSLRLGLWPVSRRQRRESRWTVVDLGIHRSD